MCVYIYKYICIHVYVCVCIYMWVNPGVFPIGPPLALIVAQLGTRPSVLSTLQQYSHISRSR